MKRVLSLLLALSILCSLSVSTGFSAYAATTKTGSCGESATYVLDTANGAMTISGSGTITGGFENINSMIRTVTIRSGITEIGDMVFNGCSALTSITIPDSVISISEFAFQNCSSLTGITIPDSVTSIGDGAFNFCSSLTDIVIPSSVTEIGWWAFANCSGLTSITIPSSVTCIGAAAFGYCDCLLSITVDQGNLYYASFDGVLYNKSKTELVQCPGGKNGVFSIPDSVISINNEAFASCSKLSGVTIPAGVTDIGSFAFLDCSKFTDISLPSGLISIGDSAFNGCKSLTSITVPSSVTSIGNYAFCCCDSLNNIAIPNGLTKISEGIFYGCTNLTNATIPDSVISIGYSAFNGCTSLTSISIGNSVTSIGAYAFKGCTSLTSITIPLSVTSIVRNAFNVCDSLAMIIVDQQNSVYASQDGVLYNKSKTELIRYPEGKNGTFVIPTSVNSISDSAFYRCSSLTGITIPNSVTSIGECAFEYCSGLTSITIPGSVNSIEGFTFDGCSNLKELKVLNSSCEMIDLGLVTSTVVYGFKNSSAQQYAKQNSLSFVEIKACTDVHLNHSYKEKSRVLTKATTAKDGRLVITYICARCGVGYSKTTQTYYKVNNIKLNKTAYTYNGKVQKPSVTVKDSKGKALKNGTDYKISYPKGMKNVGKYTVKVTLKGNYSGTKSLTYNINPKGTSVSKVTAAKKGFKVTWKKQATQTTGYEVQYSTSSNFKKDNKTVTVSKNKTTSKSVSKLSAKKKYYVRVRTYKTVKINGKNVKLYSGWSKAKSVTTKK